METMPYHLEAHSEAELRRIVPFGPTSSDTLVSSAGRISLRSWAAQLDSNIRRFQEMIFIRKSIEE